MTTQRLSRIARYAFAHLLLIFTLPAVVPSYAQAADTAGAELHLISTCRVLDTRKLGGPIPNGQEYGFKVRGQVGGSQGGTANCGVPVEAAAVVLNVVATGTQGPGHVEAYPFSQRPPLPTSRVNYKAFDTIANEIIVSLLPWSSGTNDVTIRPAVSPTHLVADAIAYYTETRKGPAEVISITLVGIGQVGIVYDVETTSGTLRCDPSYLGVGSNACGEFPIGSCVFATGHPKGLAFFPHTIVESECP